MKFYFETYGCTTNRADSDIMKGVVRENGHEVVEDIEDADTAVLNTCIVIAKTENRMFRRIKELSDRDAGLVVAGCLSATAEDRIKEVDEDITIIRPEEPGRIAEIFEGEVLEKYHAPHSLDGKIGRVQIAEGCKGNCSYCITKYARGRLESFPISSIIDSIRSLVNRGAREIRLTAQDTGVYGRDRDTDLAELLSEIGNIDGDFRVRVGMMNPMMSMETFESVIEVMDSERFYSFLHIPVQSGSERVLERMRRGYSPDKFERMLEMAREKLGATVSTDVLPGFPGEGEEEFRKTVELLEEVRPDIINITRFSPRPGTDAEKLDAPASNPVKRRSKELTELRNRICGGIRKAMEGEERRVTVMEKGKEGSVIARDRFYNPVVIKEDLDVGTDMTVRITEGKWSYLVGEIVQ